MLKTLIMKATFIAFLGSISFVAHAIADTQRFDVPAGDLIVALESFAKQAEVDLVYQDEQVKGLRTGGVTGDLSPHDAVIKLLEGTPLTVRRDEASGAILITTPTPRGRPASPISTTSEAKEKAGRHADSAAAHGEKKSFWDRFRVAQTSPSQGEDPGQGKQVGEPHSSLKKTELEEIVVTGTHIRGAGPIGSPLLVIDREEIERSSYTTVQQFMEALPQNFDGGASEDNPNVNNSRNVSGGSGVNLRGLGTDSTLVLINGRRAARGGVQGDYVDVSIIPLSAVERIEILSDGASALYGSDAVAGVVNFVLRDRYEGAETAILYGSASDGVAPEIKASQILGTNWNRGGGGNVLLSYQYLERDPMPASKRDLTADSDLRRFGGTNRSNVASNPGNIIASGTTYAIPTGQDGTNLTPQDLLAGQINLLNTNLSRDWLKGYKTHALSLTGRQNISSALEAFGEVRFARREYEGRSRPATATLTVSNTHPYFVSPSPGASSVRMQYSMIDDLGPTFDHGNVAASSAVVGLSYRINDNWHLDFSAAGARNRNHDMQENRHSPSRMREALGFDNPATPFNAAVDGYFNPFADGSNTPQNVLDYIRTSLDNVFEGEIWSTNALLSGELFELPAGPVRVALGTDFYEESFLGRFMILNRDGPESAVVSADESRQVLAAFGEVQVPIVTPQNAKPGLNRLEISLAGRYEEYSDFGTTFNPKVGLAWEPVPNMRLRGSYGTSFKAPRFTDLVGLGATDARLLTDPATPTEFLVALVRVGSNPDLQPEESRSWTAGIDFRWSAMPGFGASLTYFDIDYEDRITNPGDPGTFLSDPVTFAPLINRSPNLAFVASLLASPDFDPSIGGTPVPEDVDVILDGRTSNISVTQVSGVDLTLSQRLDWNSYGLNLSINGSYLFEFKNAVTATAPLIDVISTVRNPIDLRLSASIGVSRGPWRVDSLIHYMNDYWDNLSVQNQRVAIGSWTTLDLNVRYVLDGAARVNWLANSTIALGVRNVFDTDPPFVDSSIGVGYDVANGNPLGRFISLQVKKEWGRE